MGSARPQLGHPRRNARRPDAPPVTFYPPFLFLWTTVPFDGYGLRLFLKERAPGGRGGGSRRHARKLRRLVAMTHDIDWLDDPHGQTVRSATIEATYSDGTRRPLRVRTLPARYCLKGGLYGGLEGWFQGDDKGKLHAAHDRWNLRTPEARKRARTLSDHVIEVRDGDNVGWGIMEYGVGEGYERYAEVQRHPAI